MIYHRAITRCEHDGDTFVSFGDDGHSARAVPRSAQAYPSKPIHIVVPFAPGGITDILARALAQRLTEAWGQQVVIENKPGANSHIGADLVAKAAPDGYTLLVSADTTFVMNPHLYAKLGYDPVKDFAPISGLGISPQALVVHPSVPVKTFAELIALAKKNPDALNYGTFGIRLERPSQHGADGDVDRREVHAQFTIKAPTPAITDVLGGHIQMIIVSIGLVRKHFEAGTLKLLGFGSTARLAEFPDVPTIAESFAGLRGGLLVRPGGAEGHAARHRRQAQCGNAEDLRRPGVPRKISWRRR